MSFRVGGLGLWLFVVWILDFGFWMPHTETKGRFEGGLVWMEFIIGVPNAVLGNLHACSAGTGVQEVSAGLGPGFPFSTLSRKGC